MRQGADMGKVFFGQIKKFHRDDLTFFDESDQLFLRSEGNVLTFVHDCDPRADLLDFFHIVGCIDDGCTGAV